MLNLKRTDLTRKKYHYLFIVSAMVMAACIIMYPVFKMGDVSIKPLDKEFNSELKFGVQYYIISGYGNSDPEELASIIHRCRNANLNMFSSAGMILFYKYSFFSNYKSHMYESARDNEFGGIEGFQENLVAKLWFEKPGARYKEHLVIYHDGEIILNQSRTY